MGSPLLSNDKVTFVALKPFTVGEKTYAVGDDFPQEDARNIETMVRARYLAPVVEDLADRPRYFYKEIKLKSELLEKLNRDRVQLRMHGEPDSDAVVDIPALTDPNDPQLEEREEPEVEESDEPPPAEAVHTGEYDPTYHTVVEVNEYLESHPDEREAILEREREGRARKGILES